jgi:iduronate 2-sulfatase
MRTALLTLVFVTVVLLRTAIAADNPRLNVLLIIADDLRPEISCYGGPVATPNIDRLAARGMRFERAYCQYPVCNPSRTSFLTGLRPDTTRVLGNSQYFRKTLPDVVTMPQRFRQAGYTTISLGKVFHRGQTMEDLKPEMDDPASWNESKYFQATATGNRGEGRNLTGGKLGWCRWLAAEGDDEDQPDGMIAREAVKALETHRDGPLFLAVGFHKPHDPFISPKRFFDAYSLEKLKLYTDPADRSPDVKHALGGGPFAEAFGAFGDAERREFMRAYYAGTAFTDVQIGKVLDALDRLQLADRTVVVFLGDHGYHLGEHGWWNKNTLFELSARAPLIIATPNGAGAGKTCKRIVEFLDLFPTIADLTGVEPPAGLQGKSLRPLLQNPSADWDRAAYTQVQRGGIAGRSVRSDRWRYTEWDDGAAGVELYDHDADAGEYHNLASDPAHADVLAKMKAIVRPK